MRPKKDPQQDEYYYHVPAYCVACGKEFYPTPEHVYKDSKGQYCCWTCFNHRNDGKETRWRQVEKCDLDGDVISIYQSAGKAAEYNYGCTSKGIIKAINSGKPYKGFIWRYKKKTVNNTCVCCGAIIPEGRQVCPNCEKGEK